MEESTSCTKPIEQESLAVATMQCSNSDSAAAAAADVQTIVDEVASSSDMQIAQLSLNDDTEQLQTVEQQEEHPPMQENEDVAGPLQKQRNRHTSTISMGALRTRAPHQYTECMFPHVADVNRRFRAAIADVCVGTFQSHMMATIKQYITGCHSEYDKAVDSTMKCRKLARTISRTLDLLRGCCTTFSDLHDYQYRISELVAIYISCELNCAKEFKEQKHCISLRITNVIYKHLYTSDEETTRKNILRLFVFMPKLYKEREVMTNIFRKFVPTPKYAQQELPDGMYIQYLILYYHWKQLEIDLEKQLRVIDQANDFMRPSKSLSSNSLYAYHLPKYESRRTATKFILQNLEFFQDLRNASMYDNCLKNSSDIVDILDDDIPSESHKNINFAEICNNTLIEPILTKPSKFEEPTILDVVDLTCEEDNENGSADENWLHKLRSIAKQVVAKRSFSITIPKVCDDVIEIGDSDNESDTVNVNAEPELFSLDIEEPDYINANVEEDIFNSFDDDSNQSCFDSTQFHSNIRTYIVNKQTHTINVRLENSKEVPDLTYDDIASENELTDIDRDVSNVEMKETNKVQDLTNETLDNTNAEKCTSLTEDAAIALNNTDIRTDTEKVEVQSVSILPKSDFVVSRIISQYNSSQLIPAPEITAAQNTLNSDEDNSAGLNDDESSNVNITMTGDEEVSSEKIVYSQSSQSIKSITMDYFPEVECIKENSIGSLQKDCAPIKKHVKFNETPMGPSPKTNTIKMPIKPAIINSSKYRIQQGVFSTGPFNCASPASSTNSSCDVIKDNIRKGMIEEYILLNDSDDKNDVKANCDNEDLVKFSTHPTSISKVNSDITTKNDLSVFNASHDVTSKVRIHDDNNVENTKDISSTNCNEIKTFQSSVVTLSKTNQLISDNDNSFNLSSNNINTVFDSSKCENTTTNSKAIVDANNIISIEDIKAIASTSVVQDGLSNNAKDTEKSVDFISEVSSTVGDITDIAEHRSELKENVKENVISSPQNPCQEKYEKTFSNECLTETTTNATDLYVGKQLQNINDNLDESNIIKGTPLDTQEPSSTVTDSCNKENSPAHVQLETVKDLTVNSSLNSPLINTEKLESINENSNEIIVNSVKINQNMAKYEDILNVEGTRCDQTSVIENNHDALEFQTEIATNISSIDMSNVQSPYAKEGTNSELNKQLNDINKFTNTEKVEKVIPSLIEPFYEHSSSPAPMQSCNYLYEKEDEMANINKNMDKEDKNKNTPIIGIESMCNLNTKTTTTENDVSNDSISVPSTNYVSMENITENNNDEREDCSDTELQLNCKVNTNVDPNSKNQFLLPSVSNTIGTFSLTTSPKLDLEKIDTLEVKNEVAMKEPAQKVQSDSGLVTNTSSSLNQTPLPMLELNKIDELDTKTEYNINERKNTNDFESAPLANINSSFEMPPPTTINLDKIDTIQVQEESINDSTLTTSHSNAKCEIDVKANDKDNENNLIDNANMNKTNNYGKPLWIITQNTAVDRNLGMPADESSSEDRSIKIKLSKNITQAQGNVEKIISKELRAFNEKGKHGKDNSKKKFRKEITGIEFEKLGEFKTEKPLIVNNMNTSNESNSINNLQNSEITKEKSKQIDVKSAANGSSDIDSDIEFDFDFVFGFDFDSIGNNSTEGQHVETPNNSNTSIVKEFEADKLLEEFNNTTEVIVENSLGKTKEQSVTNMRNVCLKNKGCENVSETSIATSSSTSCTSYTPLTATLSTSSSLVGKSISTPKVTVGEKSQNAMPIELANDLIDLNEELIPTSGLNQGAPLLTDFAAAITPNPIESQVQKSTKETTNLQNVPLNHSVGLELNHGIENNELKISSNSLIKTFSGRLDKKMHSEKSDLLWHPHNLLSFAPRKSTEEVFAQIGESNATKYPQSHHKFITKSAKSKVSKQTIEQEFSKVQTQMAQLGISATISLDPKTPSLIVSIPTNSIKNLKETLYKCGNTADNTPDGPSTSASVLSTLSEYTNAQLKNTKDAPKGVNEQVATGKHFSSDLKNLKEKTISYKVLEESSLNMSRQVLFRGIANYSPDPENLHLDITLPLKKRRKLSEFQDEDVLTYTAPITEEDDNSAEDSNSLTSDAESIKRSLNENTTFFMQLVAKKLNNIFMQGKQVNTIESVREESNVTNAKKSDETNERKSEDTVKVFSNDKSMQPISQKEIVTCEADSSGSVVATTNNITCTDPTPQPMDAPSVDYPRNRLTRNRLQPQVNMVAPQLKNRNSNMDKFNNSKESNSKCTTKNSALPVSYPATPMFSVANFEKLVRLQRYIDMLIACVDVTELISSASLQGTSVDINVYEEARAVILEQATILSTEDNGSSKPLLLKQHTDGSISILNDNDDGNEWLVLPASTAKQLHKVSTALTLLQEQQKIPMNEYENPVRTRIELALRRLVQKSKGSKLSNRTDPVNYVDKNVTNLLNCKVGNHSNTIYQHTVGIQQEMLRTTQSPSMQNNYNVTNDLGHTQMFTRALPPNAQTMLIFNENPSNAGTTTMYDLQSGSEKCSDQLQMNMTNVSSVMHIPQLLPPPKYKESNPFNCSTFTTVTLDKSKNNLYDFNAQNNYDNYFNNKTTSAIETSLPTNLALSKQQTMASHSLSEQQKYNEHFHTYHQTPISEPYQQLNPIHSMTPVQYQSTLIEIPHLQNHNMQSFKIAAVPAVEPVEYMDITQLTVPHQQHDAEQRFHTTLNNYTNVPSNTDLPYTATTHSMQSFNEEQTMQLTTDQDQNVPNQNATVELYEGTVVSLLQPTDINFSKLDKPSHVSEEYSQKETTPSLQTTTLTSSLRAIRPKTQIQTNAANTLNSTAPKKRGRPRKYDVAVVNEKKPKTDMMLSPTTNCRTPTEIHHFTTPPSPLDSTATLLPNLSVNSTPHSQTFTPNTDQQFAQQQQDHKIVKPTASKKHMEAIPTLFGAYGIARGLRFADDKFANKSKATTSPNVKQRILPVAKLTTPRKRGPQPKSKILADMYNDPKLYQRCEVKLEHCPAAEQAKVQLFNRLLEEQRRKLSGHNRERALSLDDEEIYVNNRGVQRRQTLTSIPTTTRKTQRTKLPVKRTKCDGRMTVPLTKARRMPAKQQQERCNLEDDLGQQLENNANLNGLLETVSGPTKTTPSETNLQVVETMNSSTSTNTITACNNWDDSDDNLLIPLMSRSFDSEDNSLLIPIIPRAPVRRKKVKSRKPYTKKTETLPPRNYTKRKNAKSKEKKLAPSPTLSGVPAEQCNTIDPIHDAASVLKSGHKPTFTPAETLATLVAAMDATVCSTIGQQQPSSAEFTAAAINSLTLLADTAATTAPMPSNENYSRNTTVFVTPASSVELQLTAQQPSQPPVENASSVISTAVECECGGMTHMPMTPQPQLPLLQWSTELRNTATSAANSIINESSHMSYQNLDAPSTVPAYLFNGESRDVPTPTLLAAATITNDHEVSSTQESDCKTTSSKRNNSNGNNSTRTLLSSLLTSPLGNGQCQDNQVDTTYLPESSSSSVGGKRTRKLSAPDMGATHQRPGRKRRKTICSESSEHWPTAAESIYTSSMISPSTTTSMSASATIANSRKKTVGRKRKPKLKRISLSSATEDYTLKKHSGSPVFADINSVTVATAHTLPRHTYSKYSQAQTVFVPPDIEECLESDTGLGAELDAISTGSKSLLNDPKSASYKQRGSKRNATKSTANANRKKSVNLKNINEVKIDAPRRGRKPTKAGAMAKSSGENITTVALRQSPLPVRKRRKKLPK